jgi:hypothetical protein
MTDTINKRTPVDPVYTAINETYGKGFNPEAMEGLYKALELAHENLKCQNAWLNKPEWEQIEQALKNAKL